MDELTGRYVRARGTLDRLVCETVMLRTLGSEVTNERDTLRNELEETRRQLTAAVQAESTARAMVLAAVEERDATRTAFVGAVNCLRHFRQILSCLPVLVSVFDTITRVGAEGAEFPANVPRLSLTGRERQ